MEIWKRNLGLVWLSQLFSTSGFSAAIPFIPLFIKQRLGVTDEGQCGMYVAMFYFFGQLAFALAAPIWGKLADRFGRRLMLLRASFIGGIFFPMMMFSTDIVWLIVFRVLSCSFSGTVNAAQTLVASETPESHQGMALGTLSSAVWSGNMLGFFIGGMVVEHFGFDVAFFVCGINFWLAGTVALLIRENFVPPVQVRRSASAHWHFKLPDFAPGIWLLLAMFVVIGILRNFEIPYLAMKIEQIAPVGRAAGYTGLISALAALAAIGSGTLLGILSDRWPARRIVVPVMLITGLMNVVQGLTGALLVFGSARFAAYFFGGGLEPVLQRLLSSKVSREQRGSVFGFSASARTIGAMVSVVLTGTIIYHWGTVSVFVISGVLFMLLAYPAGRGVSRIDFKKQLNLGK